MAKIVLETIRNISFETKPKNEGISFRRMKRFRIFRWKDGRKWKSKIVKIGKYWTFCSLLYNRVSKSIAIFENSEKISWKKSLHVFILCFHFFANSQTMCYYKWGSSISSIWNGAHLLGALKIKLGFELYYYKARNYLKMSSKMYKFVMGAKKQETSAKLRLRSSPHFIAN